MIMRIHPVHRYAALLMLLLLPLQGLAAVVTPMLCLAGTHHESMAVAAPVQHEGCHEAIADTDPSAPGGTHGNMANHLCCNFVLSVFALPLVEPPGLASATPLYVPSFLLLFVPELPQRPPRG